MHLLSQKSASGYKVRHLVRHKKRPTDPSSKYSSIKVMNHKVMARRWTSKCSRLSALCLSHWVTFPKATPRHQLKSIAPYWSPLSLARCKAEWRRHFYESTIVGRWASETARLIAVALGLCLVDRNRSL